MNDVYGFGLPAGVHDRDIDARFGECVIECEECGRKFVPNDSGDMNEVVCQRCRKLLGETEE